VAKSLPKGVLIECDPSIKSIIMNIDSERSDYILHDLDDTHLVIQENKVQDLKRKLDEVGSPSPEHVDVQVAVLTKHSA
jgi:TFIIH basal transcription factor complex TTD-A subunit